MAWHMLSPGNAIAIIIIVIYQMPSACRLLTVAQACKAGTTVTFILQKRKLRHWKH